MALHLTIRQLRTSFGTESTGWIAILVVPLLLLGVYAFVFGVIFQARAPATLDVPFVAWLAVALWPWLAFSDGVARGAGAIRQHAAVLTKVPIPRRLFCISTQSAAFTVQVCSYAVVLLILALSGVELHLRSIPYVVLVLATLYVFSLGAAMLASALQVFLRDLESLLPILLMVWFFLTPILYSPELLPEGIDSWLVLNPMAWWMEEFRDALFAGKWLPDLGSLRLPLLAAASLWFGHYVFEKLSPWFEDFL